MDTKPMFGDDDGGPRTKRIRPVRSMGNWEDIADADMTSPEELTILWS
jgi:hypothetical protein